MITLNQIGRDTGAGLTTVRRAATELCIAGWYQYVPGVQGCKQRVFSDEDGVRIKAKIAERRLRPQCHKPRQRYFLLIKEGKEWYFKHSGTKQYLKKYELQYKQEGHRIRYRPIQEVFV